VVATVYEETDLIGINYNLDAYEPLHEKYPYLPVLSTENSATSTTRGWYGPDSPELGYYNAYDKDTTRIFLGRERTWKFLLERPWVMGGYQWSGFEHRGETVWPRLCSQAGAIDLFLQKKDAFYQNQSFWSKTPMVHIMPHWNIDTFDGEPVPVVLYTNCEEVELLLNGKSLGRRAAEPNTALRWPVDYEPGKLEAIGYRDKKACAADAVETAGAPQKLMLRLENAFKKAGDVAIVTCYAVDEKGRLVPTACPEVTFSTGGGGAVISTGSDVTDHTPLSSPIRKMRAGLLSVAVGVKTDKGSYTAQSGTIALYAQAPGLQSARLLIPFGNE
jgi:beta-galactosidase